MRRRKPRSASAKKLDICKVKKIRVGYTQRVKTRPEEKPAIKAGFLLGKFDKITLRVSNLSQPLDRRFVKKML